MTKSFLIGKPSGSVPPEIKLENFHRDLYNLFMWMWMYVMYVEVDNLTIDKFHIISINIIS